MTNTVLLREISVTGCGSLIGDKYQKLQEIIKGYGSVLVAFSGGTDSTFLASVCRDVLKDRCGAATIRHLAHREQEIAEAVDLARFLGMKHLVIDATEETRSIFEDNQTNRCFYCKSAIGLLLKSQAQAWGLSTVLDASQIDDLAQSRPGMQAIMNLDIRTPLIEAGFNKREIRAWSQRLSLPNYDKPASPCLATRFPTGQPVTAAGLRMIAEAEDCLAHLGFCGVRVRLDRGMARIEVHPEDVHRLTSELNINTIVPTLKSLGFANILLDVEGYRNNLASMYEGRGRIT